MTMPFLSPKRTNNGRVFEHKNGKKVYWTLDRIKMGVEKFLSENEKYPSASDFNHKEFMNLVKHCVPNVVF